MSALRRMLAAAALVCAAAAPARAQDSVVVAVGGDLAARTGEFIAVPVTVDVSAAPGRLLGGYRLTLAFDPARLQYYGVASTAFAQPLVATDSAYAFGRVRLTAVMPAGAPGLVQLFVAQFLVLSDTAPTAVTIELADLSASAGSVTPFEDLMPLARVLNGTFCRSLGRWGDLDHDGRANSRDALMALSAVVGLPLGDTLATAALGDVDDDGAVSSRDALVILSYAVGLPVPGFRVLLTAAGACGTAATTLVIRPDTIELQVGQTATVLVQATDRLGRAVPAGPLTWLSSDPSIAAFEGSAETIEGRGAGTATLTAELGPGVRAQLTAIVVTRRVTWYVDIRRARNSPTRTGSFATPFEFIGDALDEALDGDTIRVAGGVYEEVVSNYRSVSLIGDSLDRAVIDPRGAPYWYGGQAVNLGNGGGFVEIAHLVVRAGGVYLESRDQSVHNVLVEAPGTYAGIETYNQNNYDGGGDLRATPAATSVALGGGQTIIQNVVVRGVTDRGIRVEYGDTVVVRNTLVVGDSTLVSCSVYSWGDGGIIIDGGRSVLVEDNTVTGIPCAGIGAFARRGPARVDRNRVTHIGSVGIAGSGPDFRTSGNYVRGIGSDTSYYYYYYNVYGIWISDNDGPQDTLRSYADTVVDVEGYYTFGIYADSVVNAAVDLFRADSIGLNPNAYDGVGVEVRSAWLTMANARIRDVRTAGFRSQSLRRAIGLRDNEYRNIGGGAVTVYAWCECSDAVDSVTIVGDTMDVVGGGVQVDGARFVTIDSVSVDSAAYDGVYVSVATDLRVQRSSIVRSNSGLGANSVTRALFSALTLASDTTGLRYYTYGSADSAWVNGVSITGGGVGFLVSGGTVLFDSSVVASNVYGVDAQDGTLRATRIRFQGNTNGLTAYAYADSISIARSNFLGNTAFAVLNSSSYGIDADSNYWNHSLGPVCGAGASGCDSLAAGDTIGGIVIFAPVSAAAQPTPAPQRTLVAAAPRMSGTQVELIRGRAGRPAAVRQAAPARQPAPAVTPRPAAAPRQFVAPWRKGRPAAAAPQRP